MTKFIIDANVAIHIVSEGITVSSAHELLAPTLIRSQVLSLLHQATVRGEVGSDAALAHLGSTAKLPIRLLGDAVLRRQAWKVAEQLGWASTYDAEYIALTQLQGDALVTLDEALATSAKTLVEVASIDALS